MQTLPDHLHKKLELLRAYSQLPILESIAQLQYEVEALRPFSREVEDRIFQKFRLDWNFHSNAIEGNSLTYGETVSFLMHGLTAKGKPLKDHLDIRGHNDAITILWEMVQTDTVLREMDIRELHRVILVEPYTTQARTADGIAVQKRIQLGEYKTMPNHVLTATGAMHYYATPEETPARMRDLMDVYQIAQHDERVHPLVLAAWLHHEFVNIHPFDDGNGRMARLLMNLVLMKKHYPPIVIQQAKNERNAYYDALSQADVGDLHPFIEYLAERLQHSLDIQLRGARGESLEEPDDVDKELALFKQEFAGIKYDTPETRQECIDKSIAPFFKALELKLNSFQELFKGVHRWIWLDKTYQKAYKDVPHFNPIPSINTQQFVFFASSFKYGLVANSLGVFTALRFANMDYTIDFWIGINPTFVKNNPQTSRIKTVLFKFSYNHQLTTEEINNAVHKVGKAFLEAIKKLRDQHS